MSIIDKVKSLIEDSHASGYASELPASVTRVFDELAGEIEKIKPAAAAAAAPLASIEQLAGTLRQEFADAIAAAVGKVGQDLDAKLTAAEAAISGRLADVFKAWAAKQAGGTAAEQPASQAPAAPVPQPAAPAAPAAAAPAPAPAPQPDPQPAAAAPAATAPPEAAPQA